MHGSRFAAVVWVLVAGLAAPASARPLDACRAAFEASAVGARATVIMRDTPALSIVDEAHAQRRALQQDVLIMLDPERQRSHLATARLSVREERRRMLAALPDRAAAAPSWDERACATLAAGTAVLEADRRQRAGMLALAIACSAVFALVLVRTRTSSPRPRRAERSSG